MSRVTITLELRGTGGNQRGGDAMLTVGAAKLRAGAYYDPGPRMSHIGLWQTRLGSLRGVNLRFKVRGGYVTCLLHSIRPR